MAESNWEDRLPAPSASKTLPWEKRLPLPDRTPGPHPENSSGTLQFGPWDTGIKTGVAQERWLAGLGAGAHYLARGAALRGTQLAGVVGLASPATVKRAEAEAQETAARDAPLLATHEGGRGNELGQMAVPLPLGLVKGAGTLAGAAGMGTFLGATQPQVQSAWETAKDAGLGLLMGVGGNAVGRTAVGLYGGAKSAIQPFFETGQKDIISKLVNRFTPDRERALRNIAADPGELVPGSLPTAAQAAQLEGVTALDKSVRQTPGSSGAQAMIDRDQANNAARVAAVRKVAGDPGKRAFFEADRESTADQLYGAARANGIDPGRLTPEALQNIADFANRLPPQVLANARALAKAKGTPMTDETSIDGMHWIKKSLDGLISKESGPTGDSVWRDTYIGLKNDLLKGMENLSPDYAAARATYEAMSRPINQMDVGEVLADKLIPSINDFGGNNNLNASGFTGAMRNGDAVAQKALGFPGATMADVLEPAQMQTLNGIGQDMARQGNAFNLGKARGSDTVANAVSANTIDSVMAPLGLPKVVASATENSALASLLRPLKWAAEAGTSRVADRLGETMLSPQAFADALMRSPANLLSRSVMNLPGYAGPVAAAYGNTTTIPKIVLNNMAPDAPD